MGIFNRIGRLWKADIHGIIDSLEEPRAILKQALREMEEEIEGTTAHLESIRSEEERQAKRRARLGDSLEETIKQIDVAFGADDQRLARTFVRKRLELERVIAHVDQRIAELAAEHSGVEQRLTGQKEQYQRVAEKAELLCDQPEAKRDCGPDGPGAELFVSEHDVEVAMLEEKNRRSSGTRKSAGSAQSQAV